MLLELPASGICSPEGLALTLHCTMSGHRWLCVDTACVPGTYTRVTGRACLACSQKLDLDKERHERTHEEMAAEAAELRALF